MDLPIDARRAPFKAKYIDEETGMLNRWFSFGQDPNDGTRHLGDAARDTFIGLTKTQADRLVAARNVFVDTVMEVLNGENWHPEETAPAGVWLRTRRAGEENENVCRLLVHAGGSEREWSERFFPHRTTMLNTPFAPPTEWALLTPRAEFEVRILHNIDAGRISVRAGANLLGWDTDAVQMKLWGEVCQ